MAGFNHVFRQDYDKRIKLGDEYVFCYSKKKLLELYPEKDFSLSGEARKGSRKSQESFDARQTKKLARLKEKGLKESDVETLKIGDLKIGNSVLSVYPEGTNNKFLGKTDGYVCISEGNFITLHASRIPFLAIIFSMSAAIIGATLLTVSLLMNPAPPEVIEPDNPLPVVDPMVKPSDDNEEKVISEQGGGSITVEFMGNVTVNTTKNIAGLNYTNPNSSNQDVVLELYIVQGGQEYFLGRSGRVPAGSSLYQISVKDREVELRGGGLYSGKVYFHAYDPVTGAKAHVVSDISNIDVFVQQ